MCRIAAWNGAPCALADVILDPAHSLLVQSQNAQEAKLTVNGDGFGIAWYDDHQTQPGLYRDTMPAWSDGNLPSLCRMIRAPVFLSHVRASTMGETSRANCHPFAHGRWSFCHNGQIPAFPALRRRLEAALPDALYHARRGTTDSEMFFLTLLANGFDEAPSTALIKTLRQLAPEAGAAPNRVTILLSDGRRLLAFRHASDNRAPTLYLRRTSDGHVLASEPLEGRRHGWTALPSDVLLSIEGGKVSHHPIQLGRDQERLAG